MQTMQTMQSNRVVELPNISQVNILLQRPVYDVQPFNELSNPLISFRNLFEGWRNFQNERISVIHNVVHLWVGGDMLTMGSSNDPVFWLHHCFIDALYYGWQSLHPYTSNGENDKVMGEGQYNVVLTEVPFTVYIENGDSKLVSKRKDAKLTKYFAPGYYINIESDADDAYCDTKLRTYESFIIDTVTDTTITFSQQSTYNTYNFNNIRNGKGYVSEVYGTIQKDSNILVLSDNSENKIKHKYIEDLKIGDKITLPLSNNPETNFFAVVKKIGNDGTSVILDRINKKEAIINKLLLKQAYYHGSSGNKKIYLGGHYGSNLDDFIAELPKQVPIKCLLLIDELPYKYALNFPSIPISFNPD